MAKGNLWVFVRHGESQANADGTLSGWQDVELTDRGRQDALDARAKLEGAKLLGKRGRIEQAVCSDLRRAHATAAIILEPHPMPLTVTRALRERSCGRWQGRERAPLQRRGHLAMLRSWRGRPPGGESLAQVALRSCRWLAERPEVPTLVVAHGALLRAVLCLLDEGDVSDPRYRVKNGEVIERRVPKGAFRALAERLLEEGPPQA